MSVQATSWVIKHSKHKGSALLLLIMISNHAHADGTNAFPSVKTLADECRMSPRQVIRLIAELEESGELLVARSTGRVAHKFSVVMELNPDKLSRLNTDKMSVLNGANPDKSDKPTLTNRSPNTDTQGARYKEEPLNRKIEKRESGGEAAPAPDKKHKAIATFRAVTSFYPHKDLYKTVAERLGDDPDFEKLTAVWQTWLARGHNPMNTEGLLDWYEAGIPPKKSARGMSEPGYFKGQVVDTIDGDDEAFAEVPRRPPADVTREEAAAWNAVLANLEKKLNKDVFNTWFKAVIFDGITPGDGDGFSRSVKLRAGRVTHDWIRRYYDELLEAAVWTALGDTAFSITWEVEDEP